jgi:hypothetical protein
VNNIYIFSILFLLSSIILRGQDDLSKSIYLNIDKSEILINQIQTSVKKIRTLKNVGEIANKINNIDVNTGLLLELSTLIEKKCDSLENFYKSLDCLDAALDADDSEDYARLLSFQINEIKTFGNKAQKAKDFQYLNVYLAKIESYCKDALESIKNTNLELESASKNFKMCTQY